MKKTGIIMMLLLLLGMVAQAAKVDDFSGYANGQVDTVTTMWKGITSGTSYVQIETDTADPNNKVLRHGVYTGGSRGFYGILPSGMQVAEGATKTMFTRFRVSNNNTNHSIGMTDDASPTGFSNYEVQVAVVDGNFLVRNGGTTITLGTVNTGWGTPFYNLWIVINNATDTYQVYLNREVRGAAYSDLKTTTPFAFRNGTTAALTRIFGFAQNDNDQRLWYDEFYISNGVNLNFRLNGPYDHSVEQGTPGGSDIPTTLKWKAAEDPAGINAVNPDIVEQYVFVGSDLDPNLRYIGKIGDPGTADPASQIPFTGTFDRTYYWAVVEAMSGTAQTFNVGDLISLVEPNNLVGPTWSYQSTKSTPIITVQPTDTRVFTTDPNAAFTVKFTSVSVPTATWYKNGSVITPDGTNVIVATNATSSVLQINTPELADEGKYYCVVSNQPGTDDDQQTGTCLLVIKKELARYEFEDTLTDTSGNGAPSGQGKYVDPLDPNEFKAIDVTLTYDPAGIQGKAVSLATRGQYIDLGTAGYPKAGPLDTIGDIRGAAYVKKGFGCGMEQGSILCWVKPMSNGVILGNANNSTAPATDATHFALSTNGTNNVRSIMRGLNYDGTAQNLGDIAGAYQMASFNMQDGQWHMLAATWDNSTLRVYFNGEQVASNTQGFPEVYNPWERSSLVGVSRTTTRYILNAADLLTGSIDNLRVYNYVKTTDEIAQEYVAMSGKIPCANHAFAGSVYNFDNTASSYCKVDLSDFAVFASNWLANGLY